jgi:hypothetical protein
MQNSCRPSQPRSNATRSMNPKQAIITVMPTRIEVEWFCKFRDKIITNRYPKTGKFKLGFLQRFWSVNREKKTIVKYVSKESPAPKGSLDTYRFRPEASTRIPAIQQRRLQCVSKRVPSLSRTVEAEKEIVSNYWRDHRSCASHSRKAGKIAKRFTRVARS